MISTGSDFTKEELALMEADALESNTSRPASLPTARRSVNVQLTDADRKAIDEARKSLNVNDVNTIVTFGSASQVPLARLSDEQLNNVKLRDTGELGNKLTEMVSVMKSIDLNALGDEKKKGFFSRLVKKADPRELFQEKFSTVSDVVERGVVELSQHATNVMRNNIFLKKQADVARSAIHQIEIDIIALDEEIYSFEDKISVLVRQYEDSGDLADAQQVNEAKEMSDMMSQRRHNLIMTRQAYLTLNGQNASMIKANTALLNGINNQIVNNIPLWKTAIAQRLTVGESLAAIAGVRAGNEFGNKLFTETASAMRLANKQIRESANEGPISLDTIKSMTSDLIGMMTDTVEIAEKGRQMRIEAEKVITSETERLKAALIATANRGAQSLTESELREKGGAAVFDNYNKGKLLE